MNQKKLKSEYQEHCYNCDVVTEKPVRCDWSRYASIERPEFDNNNLTEFRHRVESDQFVISEALLVPNGRVKNIPR